MFPRTQPGPSKNRYIPFRVLSVLQFGQHYSIMEVRDQGQMTVKSLPRLAKILRMRVTSLVEALTWLEQHNYIRNYERVVVRGLPSAAHLTLVAPPNLHGGLRVK